MTIMFSFLDYLIIALYFITVAAIGIWFGRKERNTKDYFLGARKQKWIVVGLSILATEISALTFVIGPARSFLGDFNYFQYYFGAFAGRIIIAILLLPAFYGGKVTSIYQYLEKRFGKYTQITASAFFLISRLLGSGIRMLAACLAINVVTGWNLNMVIITVIMVVIVYTTFGGIKSIIWTDAFQAIIFIGGALGVLIFLFYAIPGNMFDNIQEAIDAGKFHTFTWGIDPNNTKIFWVIFIHSLFLNIAAFGCDQDLTQRMLTCSNIKKGQKSLFLNAILGWPIVILFLTIGAMIFVYHQHYPIDFSSLALPADRDKVFPLFIIQVLPQGLKGLLVVGIFAAAMSSLDSALGAMSSSFVYDFYRPYMMPQRSEKHYLLIARITVLFLGAILTFIAILFSSETSKSLLFQAFEWASLIMGPLVGIFLLGVLTGFKGNDKVNPIIMCGTFLLLVFLKYFQNPVQPIIAWPWWISIGAIITFVFGIMLNKKAHQSQTIDGPSCAVEY